MRKPWLVFLLFFLPACLQAWPSAVTAEIQIYNPSDRFVTFSGIVMLKGKVTPGSNLKVNGVALPSGTDGDFSCGLVLKAGKNLVVISRGEEIKELRVLRLLTFPDVEGENEGEKHWARGQAVYLSSLGIIEGYPDGNFYPGNAVTRGELATWLAKAKKLPVVELTADPFFDVPKEHWRAPYVKAVTKAGFLATYSRDAFGIDEPISRREAAEVAVRVEGLGIVQKVIPLFKDVPKEEKGAVPIYTARESGLVIGVSKDIPVYDPERGITRAEAATLISRFSASQAGIRFIADFDKGFSIDKLCSLNIPPSIVSFTVQPPQAYLGQTAKIKLRAAIVSREAFAPISKVKVDLSAIGGLADAEMVDDGTAGDEVKGDQIYSLNISFEPKLAGEKLFEVTATDRLGWEGKAEASLLVLE